jgi:hypothetical protein
VFSIGFVAAKQAMSGQDSPPLKRQRLTSNENGGSVKIQVLPDVVKESEAFVEVVSALTCLLERRPFGIWARECCWDVKHDLYAKLPAIIDAVTDERREISVTSDSVENTPLGAYMLLMCQLLRSGYAQTALDRRMLVDMNAYRPGMYFLRLPEEPQYKKFKAIQVQLYVYLAEHVAFYEDASQMKEDFWESKSFELVLQEMANVFGSIPDDITADQWEMYSSDLEGPLRTIMSFAMHHTDPSSVPLESYLPFLNHVVDRVDEMDRRFGGEISAKSRGAPLEELTRLAGVFTARVLATFEDPSKAKLCGRWAVALVHFLVKLLMLEVPTCLKGDEIRGARGEIPDDRQQDTEWIEGLWEHCECMEAGTFDVKQLVGPLLERMAHMPLEEQRYRLECSAPLIPAFIELFKAELREKSVPPELSNLKSVINSVMQDGGMSMAGDLLDEISIYPCMLEFPTKRALIHSFCERTKLQGSANDPVRLVVPRNNVLDGVCDRLNLQDQNARIDVPLEIEFRSGYADDTGNELVDEGEDQGGLRRQWLDRASSHFITSDLFCSPSEDATHLEAPCGGLSTNRRAKGLIFVPSAESVCRHVQEDWQEQFELFGCILGFAILYKETIPVHLGYAFLRAVLGIKTTNEDLLPLLENVDKTLHTKLKYILSGSYNDLGDKVQDALEQSNLPNNFTVNESHCPELVETIPLKADGESIPVTEENKEEFVMLLLERVLIKGVARQVACFRRGLLRVIPEDLVQRIAELMTVKEIELMICGVDEIDVGDWEKHSSYENGYTPESQPVRWFWEAVRRMSQHQRAALLSFATGSSQVPSGGFRFLQPELFTIQRVAVTDRYPEAHTCANMVDLPEYKSLEELEQRLLFAIEEAGDAFGRR